MASRLLALGLIIFLSAAQNLTVPPTMPGTWISQGCYTDIGRTLSAGGYTDPANMTIESCIAFCDQDGFSYAGTEYASECYCDYKVAAGATQAPTADCNMECDGDLTEPCGGPNRLNLFWSGAHPPQIDPGSGLWAYVGCYTEGMTGRLLPNGVVTTGGAAKMTVDLCLSACLAAGFNLAGAEYGQECWCGNTFSNGGTIAPDGGCTTPCANNKTEYCGGDNRLVVYNFNNTLNSTMSTGVLSSGIPSATPASPAIVPTIGSYNYYGCQTETTIGRALRSNSTATDLMTLEYCSRWCIGYNLFGVEYGRECYCGNAFASSSVSAPAADCSFTCANNASEFCGAGNRLSVYRLNGTKIATSPTSALVLPPGWSYQGCWIDGFKGRILAYQFPDNAANTIESCISNCVSQNQNYTLAGVEYGTQCFCDTIIRNGGTSGAASDCDFPCPGNSDELCGAGDRLSLYSLEASQMLPTL